MNKPDLIKIINAKQQKLEEGLAKLNPDLMEISDTPQQWTVKETLVHITSWEQVLLADYARLKRGETIHELSGEEEINAWNAETRIRGKAMPLDQVLAEFHATFQQIIDWLEKLPEEELKRPFAYGMSLGEFIGEDTWKHYDEHLDQITSRQP